MFERLKGNVLKLFFSKALDKTTSMSNLDLHTLLQMWSDTQTFKTNPISYSKLPVSPMMVSLAFHVSSSMIHVMLQLMQTLIRMSHPCEENHFSQPTL